ncbi:MAG: D-alanyl-D-alanine carboxypeptidase/D-alanyl-D-alanine-endopeptidase [Bacteroidaceae bacterium]|nr:D-alanyl-D-alanine carboxypeptidase/D-alanyl-D-alanine-endopeptidase [Bacteroidaceae bacterium]
MKRLFTPLLFLCVWFPLQAQGVVDIDNVTQASDDTVYVARPTTPQLTHAQVLAGRLRALLRDHLFDHTQVGLCVYDLTDDSLIYAYHWRQRMRPASNAKIITAVTALDLLGSDYVYRTTLLTDYDPVQTYVRVNDSVVQPYVYLQGNLYVHGGFDPILGADDVRTLVQQLTNQGIREIRGNVVLDYSLKDENKRGWGWCWDDDDPPLLSLLYNGKDEFASAFYNRLLSAGIRIGGKVVGDVVPDTAQFFYQMERPIGTVMQQMMKASDNLYAESMFYQLAAQSGMRGAGRAEAAAVVDSLVARLGLDYTIYEFADGSGLSLYNYATPELLLTLLRHAYANPDIYDTLLPTMPIAGVDGTLRTRMKGTTAAGNVQAKTGTVTGVSTLSGYCTASNGHRLAFSIMNNGLRNSAQGRAFQDRVCVAMTK